MCIAVAEFSWVLPFLLQLTLWMRLKSPHQVS